MNLFFFPGGTKICLRLKKKKKNKKEEISAESEAVKLCTICYEASVASVRNLSVNPPYTNDDFADF